MIPPSKLHEHGPARSLRVAYNQLRDSAIAASVVKADGLHRTATTRGTLLGNIKLGASELAFADLEIRLFVAFNQDIMPGVNPWLEDEARHDYILCRDFEEQDVVFQPGEYQLGNAEILKPVLLPYYFRRTTYPYTGSEGQEISSWRIELPNEFGGIDVAGWNMNVRLHTYEDTAAGITRHWWEMIDPPYLFAASHDPDFSVEYPERKATLIYAARIPAASEHLDRNGNPIEWVDLNVDGRCWVPEKRIETWSENSTNKRAILGVGSEEFGEQA